MNTNSRFTDADLAAMRRLWEGGATAREIVERLPALKLTRCGVVGLAWRKGWKSNGHGPGARNKARPAAGPSAAAQRQEAVRVPKPARTCQFPFGDPRGEDFRFCGKPARPGSSYCRAHHKRCYFNPGNPSGAGGGVA